MKHQEKKFILGITFIVNFLVYLDASAVEFMLPQISILLKADIHQATRIISYYLYANTAPLLIFGAIGDMWSRKNVYVIGLLFFGTASLACALSSNVDFLIYSRLIQGCAAAMITAISPAIIVECFLEENQGKIFGYIASAVAMGYLAGPSLGGFLLEFLGWQSIFVINIPVMLVVSLVCLLKFPDSKKGTLSALKNFDYLGSLSLIVIVSIIFYVSNQHNAFGLHHRWEIYLVPILLVAIGIAGVMYSNKYFDTPVFDLFLLSENPLFLIANIAGISSFIGAYIFAFIIPFYVVNVIPLNAFEMGLLLTTFPIGFLVGAPLGGYLTNRLKPLTTLVIAQALVSIAILNVFILHSNSTVITVALVTFSIGVSRGFFVAPYNSFVMSAIPVFRAGTGGAMVALGRNFGMLMGIVIGGFIFQKIMGDIPVAYIRSDEEMMATFMHNFIIITGTSACFAVLSLSLILSMFLPALIRAKLVGSRIKAWHWLSKTEQ